MTRKYSGYDISEHDNMSTDLPLKMSIGKFKSLFPIEFDAQLGNDFFVADLRYDAALAELTHPFRFDGFLAIFCIGGDLSVDINLDSYKISENSFFLTTPQSIIRVHEVNKDTTADIHFVVVAMSSEFISGIRLDFNKLFTESVRVLDNPCIKLEGNDLEICSQYLSLAKSISNFDYPNKKEALGYLISSICYVMSSLWEKKIKEAVAVERAPSPRAKMVFEQFLHLIAEYHTKERNMAFYAERLCLTPKYLSKLVKNVSGRSAPEWIDSFVILEAKNMLRYSDASIKEIVYSLNFPNQSVFYKFFKANTGMTPSEYRNN